MMARFGVGFLGVGLLALSLWIPASSAQGQSKWLDSAKDLLGKVGQSDGTGSAGTAGVLSGSEIASGLTEAIWVGAQRVIGQLGSTGGFNGDPSVHIPLPETLTTAQSVLSKIGYGGLGEELEQALNKGAERAVPEATEVFGDAIKAMTGQDAQGILNGPDDAATQYFKRATSQPLAERFASGGAGIQHIGDGERAEIRGDIVILAVPYGALAPIVETALSETGAVQSYDRFIGQYESVPLMPDVKADLTTHVVEKALAGLFLYLAKEETAIRRNPAARSTDLLKKVFSGL